MERLIKQISNNGRVVFDQGNFDHWCVYVVNSDGYRKAPRDVHYFSDLLKLSEKYSARKVYNDFVKIYDRTTSTISDKVKALIDEIAESYRSEDRAMAEKWFTVLYAGMIAEENKNRAILKKRIKRLGMHQVLIEKILPQTAANFSKGKTWRELDRMMKQKGF
ncbi:MAG: hypothetical protein U9N85_07525 [Bacteroidota bacterium]|nr:hypothetical protein [Bacteroidota bacterium]